MGNGYGGEDAGEAVLGGVVEAGKDDGGVAGHFEGGNHELVSF